MRRSRASVRAASGHPTWVECSPAPGPRDAERRVRIQGYRGSSAFFLSAGWLYEEVRVDDNMA